MIFKNNSFPSCFFSLMNIVDVSSLSYLISLYSYPRIEFFVIVVVVKVSVEQTNRQSNQGLQG